MKFSLADKIQITETDILFNGMMIFGDNVPECYANGDKGFRMLLSEDNEVDIEFDVTFPSPEHPKNAWKLELATYDTNGRSEYTNYFNPELFMLNLLKYFTHHLLEVNGGSPTQWKSLIELTNVLRSHNDNVRQQSEIFKLGCPVLGVVKTGYEEDPLEVSKEQEGLAQGIIALISTIA